MSFLRHILGPRSAFDGGLFLPDRKATLARRPIQTLHPDGLLHVPLTARADLKTECIVKVGDDVVRGQALSRALQADAINAHAPTAGKIIANGRVWTAHDGFLPVVTLEPDGSDRRIPRHQGWDEESIITQLAEHGAMCSAPRAPLHIVMRSAIERGATTLIVNAMETEPYLCANLRTLVEHPGRMIDAICDLADAMCVSQAILALPYRHRRVVRRLRHEVTGRDVSIEALANPYPQCHPVMLIKAILDMEVPAGGSPLDCGVSVLPLDSVRQAADALIADEPVTDALITVAGDAIEHAGTYRVAIGTPLSDLARRLDIRAPVRQVIVGGPLTGVPLGYRDSVVTSAMTGVLFFGQKDDVRPVSCIRCGWCIEDCPVGIDPQALMRLEVVEQPGRQSVVDLQACIECGLCSHVCPSRLPVAESIYRARARLAEPAGKPS